MAESSGRRTPLILILVQVIVIALATYFMLKGEYYYSIFLFAFMLLVTSMFQAFGAKRRANSSIIGQQQGRLFGVKTGMLFTIELNKKEGCEWAPSFDESEFKLVRAVQFEKGKEFTFEAMKTGRCVIKMICASKDTKQEAVVKYTVVVS